MDYKKEIEEFDVVMHFRGPVVRVQFQMDGGFGGDWNTHLNDDKSGRPMVMSERALDDAVMSLNLLRDPRPLRELKEFRAERRRRIEAHFRYCARQLIEQVEAKEEWDAWLSRVETAGVISAAD